MLIILAILVWAGLALSIALAAFKDPEFEPCPSAYTQVIILSLAAAPVILFMTVFKLFFQPDSFNK